MIYRPLGCSELYVSALGLGCMGMSEFYGPTDEYENLRTLDRAVELGVNFLDTADMYGPYRNEELLGRFLKGKRDQVVLATKFGIVRSADPIARGVDNSAVHIRRSIEGSLKRLGTDYIDLYYVHRIDPLVPIESTMDILAGLVRDGKIRAIGLSEPSIATLRRAQAVHPVAAVQSEYSLFTRDPEIDGVLEACRELKIAFVAYSPLGRGMLTAEAPMPGALTDNDFRRRLPRWQADAWAANMQLTDVVKAASNIVGASPAQVALAWLFSRGNDIIPIPGTRKVKRLEENAKAVGLQLPDVILDVLDLNFAPTAVRGARSTPQGMELLKK